MKIPASQAATPEGTEPEAAYRGAFNIRTGRERHKRAAVYVLAHQQTRNAFVAEAVDENLAAAHASQSRSPLSHTG